MKKVAFLSCSAGRTQFTQQLFLEFGGGGVGSGGSVGKELILRLTQSSRADAGIEFGNIIIFE